MATMRTPPAAVREMKEKDPSCPITLRALRLWMKEGKVHGVSVGRTSLVNMESLEQFLNGQQD